MLISDGYQNLLVFHASLSVTCLVSILPPRLVLQWEKLQMTASERRKIMCSVTFHVIAITCVVWSLYVLIDRTADEIRQGRRAAHSSFEFVVFRARSVRPRFASICVFIHTFIRVTQAQLFSVRFCPAKMGARVGVVRSQRPRPASKSAAECARKNR